MPRLIPRSRTTLCLWAIAWVLLSLPSPTLGQEPEKPIGEAPEERNAEDVFLRGQKVLLGRGDVVVDVGQFFSRSDDQQLAIVNGALALATREQSILSTLLFGRVGVLNETEVFAGTTFNHQTNQIFFGDIDLARSGRSELGDLNVGVRRTVMHESTGRPDIIATFDTVIPSGDDSAYLLGGGLVLVKSVDPVVLFAGVNYHRSLARDLDDGTRLKPGNLGDLSLGYALALNDSLAISTAASALFSRARTFENLESRRVDTFGLRFALTSSLARGLYIEPSVSLGLSGPARSFAFGVTLPVLLLTIAWCDEAARLRRPRGRDEPGFSPPRRPGGGSVWVQEVRGVVAVSDRGRQDSRLSRSAPARP